MKKQTNQTRFKKERPLRAVKRSQGFTIIELMTTVAIVGILSAVALPNYTRSVCKSDLAEAISELTMLQTAAMSYRDEYGNSPDTWDQINTLMPIQTLTNPNSDNPTKTVATGAITEGQRLRSNKYDITGETNGDVVDFNAEPKQGCENHDAKVCINTQSGKSDLTKGNGTTTGKASKPSCT